MRNNLHLSDLSTEQILSLLSDDAQTSTDKNSMNTVKSKTVKSNTITSDEFVSFLENDLL